MRHLLTLFSNIVLLFSISCQTQKMVQKISDVKKLEINKAQFIGKPLRNLLAQIEPKIKFVYGNPENTWAGAMGGTYLNLHFVYKDEGLKQFSKNITPFGIIVEFPLEPDNHRKPLPKGGLKEWTKEQTKEYGDMTIRNIRVTGEQ